MTVPPAPDADAVFGAPRASGAQYRIARGGAEAVVAALAGALRTYRLDGVDLTEPYGPDMVPPAGNGIQMSPWPNRVAGGRWELDGAAQQLDVTEPSRGHASHGLLRNTHFTAESVAEDAVTLRGEIHPQHGWPFRLTHRVAYALDDAGALTVTMSLENHADAEAPVAFGAHPFLRIGDVPSAELTLQVPAREWIRTGEDLIPVETLPVDGGPQDFRSGRPVGAQGLDVGLTGLEADADGLHRARLLAPDGRSVTLWSDPAFTVTHVFVTDRLPGRDVAVAVEPLTAPADALNSGTGLHRLAPGATLTARWGLVPDLAPAAPAAAPKEDAA
ncbi:aldose 1-epimerase family protein [Micrococcus porci]|uniref:aldose 1-epimerase family protein n=1 Tax=Micrococcus TaxID=1269 RepID=UPI001CCFFC44|nr:MULTISPECIES: aldose 1-epimerase family protein [Micrococcus]MCG7421903.1 aldose 1-epimerase family protein [Micrococcus sp. ACRRV]UBH24537.1 aldose 1-epimerase family protein [Micrococcus porci]